MAYRVITIARTLGAGGEELGRTLAAEFGMRYVDGEIIERAAERAGVTREEMAGAEARKGLVQRIFESFAPAGSGAGAPVTSALAQAPGYEQLIVDVIQETAAAGNVVIVAHGAAIPLARADGTLRVLVTASRGMRAARLADADPDPARAMKQVDASDAARADYFRRFYGLECEQPTHYDLVINTDHLGVAEAANLIRALQV